MTKSVMLLGRMIIHTCPGTATRSCLGRLVCGPRELDVWVNVSSLAAGVALYADGGIIEMYVGCGRHIHVVELGAVLRGVKLTLKWQVSVTCENRLPLHVPLVDQYFYRQVLAEHQSREEDAH